MIIICGHVIKSGIGMFFALHRFSFSDRGLCSRTFCMVYTGKVTNCVRTHACALRTKQGPDSTFFCGIFCVSEFNQTWSIYTLTSVITPKARISHCKIGRTNVKRGPGGFAVPLPGIVSPGNQHWSRKVLLAHVRLTF
jgi:hypothetical protein